MPAERPSDPEQWAVRELAESFRAQGEQRLRDVLDAMLCGVVVTEAVRDASGVIIDFRVAFANQAARDVFGVPFGAQIGDRLLMRYPEMARRRLFQSLIDVVETGTPHLVEDYRVALREGGSIRLSIQFSKLDDGYLCSYQTWRHPDD